MDAPITLFLEGPAADTALDELLALDGLDGAPLPADGALESTGRVSLPAAEGC